MPTIKTLEELEASPAIASTKEFLRNVKWKSFNPETGEDDDFDADVYFVKPAAGDIVKILESKKEDVDQIAMLLSKSVKVAQKDGKRIFLPYATAYKMDGAFRNALYEEFSKITGSTRKNSAPQTSDGANSSSVESAEAQ